MILRNPQNECQTGGCALAGTAVPCLFLRYAAAERYDQQSAPCRQWPRRAA
jgi:hypothetical protein